jgi:hypothetical protein
MSGLLFIVWQIDGVYCWVVEVTRKLILEVDVQFPKQLVLKCHGNYLSSILIASWYKGDIFLIFGGVEFF